MTEQDQFDKVCKDQFKAIHDTLKNIENRLFMDNGDECLQSKINRHDSWIKVMSGILAAIGAALLGVVVKLFKL